MSGPLSVLIPLDRRSLCRLVEQDRTRIEEPAGRRLSRVRCVPEMRRTLRQVVELVSAWRNCWLDRLMARADKRTGRPVAEVEQR